MGSRTRFVRRRTTRKRKKRVIICVLLLLLAVCWTRSQAYLLSMWVFTNGCSADAIPTKKTFWKILLFAPRNVQTNRSGFCLCLPSFSTAHEMSCARQSVYISCPSECRKYRSQSTLIRKQRSCQHELSQEITKGQLVPAHTQTLDVKAIFQHFSAVNERSKYKIRAQSQRRKREDLRTLFSDNGAEVRSTVEAFIRDIPPYPSTTFSGRGIVIVGGRARKYHMSYWLAVLSIRRSGCSLPIEIWFPAAEVPSRDEQLSLEKLDVVVVTFEKRGVSLGNLNRFAFKVLAITFSRYEEILYLDSDQVVLRDPTFIFSSKSYRKVGITMWKDFWLPSFAPDIQYVAKKRIEVDWTHESGQIFLNKMRVWDALLLACHFNLNHEIFYPLSNGFLGWGDKETIPLALHLVNKSLDVVEYVPDHVGIETPTGLLGNSMMQFWKDGAPIFLHANLGKFSGVLPVVASQRVRRWESSLFYHRDLPKILERVCGIDLELWMHNVTTMIQCETWYENVKKPRWYERLSRGPLLEGMFLAEQEEYLSPQIREFALLGASRLCKLERNVMECYRATLQQTLVRLEHLHVTSDANVQ